MTADKKKPIGESFRDIISSVTENEKSKQIFLKMFDNAFTEAAAALASLHEGQLRALFNAASISNENDRLFALATHLTRPSPPLGIPLELTAAYCDFDKRDLLRLEGFAKVCEAARKKNVDVQIHGFVKEQASPQQPVVIIINLGTAYGKGPGPYADLPPETPESGSGKSGPSGKPGSGNYSFDR